MKVKYAALQQVKRGNAAVKYCAAHNVKQSVPLTSAETSLSKGQLHLRSKLHVPPGTLHSKTKKDIQTDVLFVLVREGGVEGLESTPKLLGLPWSFGFGGRCSPSIRRPAVRKSPSQRWPPVHSSSDNLIFVDQLAL